MSFFVDQVPMANAKIDLEQVKLTINSKDIKIFAMEQKERHKKIIGLCQSCTLGFVAGCGEFKRFV